MFILSEFIYIYILKIRRFKMGKFTGPLFFPPYLSFDMLWEIKIRYKQKIFYNLIFLCMQICYLNLERKPNIKSIDMYVFTGQSSVALMMSHETVARTSSTSLGEDFTLLSQSFIICELLCFLCIRDARTIWGM